MLGQRIDRYQRLKPLRKIPVGSQLGLVEPRPLLDQAEGATRQRPSMMPNHRAQPSPNARRNEREVRRWVIRPVHVDDDSIELTQPGHLQLVGRSRPKTSQLVPRRPDLRQRERVRDQLCVLRARRIVQYFIVVWMSAWPIHSWTRRTSALAIIRVPKVCRRSWNLKSRRLARRNAAL